MEICIIGSDWHIQKESIRIGNGQSIKCRSDGFACLFMIMVRRKNKKHTKETNRNKT
jgi:hypothetical protein